MSVFRAVPAPSGRRGARMCVVDDAGREDGIVRKFLDGVAARGLSGETVKTYAFAAAHVLSWLRAESRRLEDVTEAALPAFVRFVESRPGAEQPEPRSTNLRLTVLRLLFVFATERDVPFGPCAPREPRPYRAAVVPGRMLPVPAAARPRARLRVKVDNSLVRPLSHKEAETFVSSFPTLRDRAIASLMLLSGLRRGETIRLRSADVDFDCGRIIVRGKGAKERVVPLAPDSAALIRRYLKTERPAGSCPRLFVGLRGEARGRPMTSAGLRSLFRNRRRMSGVVHANPHRLRHTFACEMVRGGMSLPSLQRILGHTTIEMTMRYVGVSAEDLQEQYLRALRSRPDGR